MTILCVCLNPALDITYGLDRLRPGETNRVQLLGARAGGKAINVARVLRQAEAESRVVTALGGVVGDRIGRDLHDSAIPFDAARLQAESRRTVTVAQRDGDAATVLNEPGGAVTPSEWADLVSLARRRLPDADVCVLSGSAPPGTAEGAYADLVRDAASVGVPSIVDAAGPPLLLAAEAGARILKPNIHELEATLGSVGVVAGARQLVDRGAETVVVSLGAEGVVAVTAGSTVLGRLPEPLSGNPTGAGDALVAALARGLATGETLPEMLRDAVALSAAAVLHPLAGSVELTEYAALRAAVEMEIRT